MSAPTASIALPQINADATDDARSMNVTPALFAARSGEMTAGDDRPGTGCGICRKCAPDRRGVVAIAVCRFHMGR